MTEKELEEYTEELKKRGISPGLDAIKQLLSKLDDPQDKLKAVHIAGTNGKGSILAYISSVTKEAGYKTGRYFSPSLEGEYKNIQINGRPLSRAKILVFMDKIKAADESLAKEGNRGPTLFEAQTALAFLCFVSEKTDIAVIECGMGGRLDATNVISSPLACVFAHIDMDHASFLGDTLEEIAENKAGIIKKGAELISVMQHGCEGERRSSVSAVLMNAAKKADAKICFAAPLNIRYKKDETLFDTENFKDLKISLKGDFQPANAAAAVKAVESLSKRGFEISEKALRKGLADTVWPGRFEMIKYGKFDLILDGAHNPDAAGMLKESLKHYVKGKAVFIMGMFADKEWEKTLHILAPCMSDIVCLSLPDRNRSLPGNVLAEAAMKAGIRASACGSIEEAFETARVLAQADGIKTIVATGSLSYLHSLKKMTDKNTVGKERSNR